MAIGMVATINNQSAMLASGSDSMLSPATMLALMLLAAIIGGALARRSKAPRVVGYLLAGVGLRFVVGRFYDQPDAIHDVAHRLATIKSLALGLIMFSIGQVFEARHLQAVGRRVIRLSLCEIACVVLLVATGCLVATRWSTGYLDGESIAFALLLAMVAAATAPAATLFVLNEYDAKGPTTDTMLTMTALNNVASIVLFHAAFLILATVGWVQRSSPHEHGILLNLASVTLGSAAIGVVLGLACSMLYAKLATREFIMLLVAVLMLIAFVNRLAMVHLNIPLNYLLICLFLGATFANTAADQHTLDDAMSLAAAPIYAAFFVLAGFELHLLELSALGLVGTAYVLLRTLGKSAGGYLGALWIRSPVEIRRYLGLGLLCQAGVAIGLADYANTHWATVTADGIGPHHFAVKLKAIVLGSVVLFEIAGPLALKQVAVAGGEVKAITLLRRHRRPVTTRASAWRATMDALRRALRVGRRASTTQGALTVRHIMRSNIRLLAASSSFDDVLHFVETSRFNDFPVVDGDNHYMGMVRFSDLRDILYDPHMRELVTASDLVAANVPAVDPDEPVDNLLGIFAEVDTAALPVVDSHESRRVIGLVEQRDLLRAVRTPASAAAVRLTAQDRADRPGGEA